MGTNEHGLPTQRLRIRNLNEGQTQIRLEPMCETVCVPGDALIEIEHGFDPSDVYEVDISGTRVTLYGWTHAISLVDKAGALRQIWSLDAGLQKEKGTS